MIDLALLCLGTGLGPITPVKSVSSSILEMWDLFRGTERNLVFAC